eukprot:scaffold201757_cov17-Tisochrysis_lutea.AAC.1
MPHAPITLAQSSKALSRLTTRLLHRIPPLCNSLLEGQKRGLGSMISMVGMVAGLMYAIRAQACFRKPAGPGGTIVASSFESSVSISFSLTAR